jgi:hypothetical protein
MPATKTKYGIENFDKELTKLAKKANKSKEQYLATVVSTNCSRIIAEDDVFYVYKQFLEINLIQNTTFVAELRQLYPLNATKSSKLLHLLLPDLYDRDGYTYLFVRLFALRQRNNLLNLPPLVFQYLEEKFVNREFSNKEDFLKKACDVFELWQRFAPLLKDIEILIDNFSSTRFEEFYTNKNWSKEFAIAALIPTLRYQSRLTPNLVEQRFKLSQSVLDGVDEEKLSEEIYLIHGEEQHQRILDSLFAKIPS